VYPRTLVMYYRRRKLKQCINRSSHSLLTSRCSERHMSTQHDNLQTIYVERRQRDTDSKDAFIPTPSEYSFVFNRSLPPPLLGPPTACELRVASIALERSHKDSLNTSYVPFSGHYCRQHINNCTPHDCRLKHDCDDDDDDDRCITSSQSFTSGTQLSVSTYTRRSSTAMVDSDQTVSNGDKPPYTRNQTSERQDHCTHSSNTDLCVDESDITCRGPGLDLLKDFTNGRPIFVTNKYLDKAHKVTCVIPKCKCPD